MAATRSSFDADNLELTAAMHENAMNHLEFEGWRVSFKQMDGRAQGLTLLFE